LGLAVTRAAEAEARLKPVCLNAAETRYEVKAHKLLEPRAPHQAREPPK
jgi:hypothetical protein